jgi:hypothetical protein
MANFRNSFVACDPPECSPPAIAGLRIDHWKVHTQSPFIYIAFNDDDIPQPADMFFCVKCHASSWRHLSGSSGNITKHIKSADRSLIQEGAGLAMSRQKPTIGVEHLLGLILENNLSFRFAESPRLRSLFSRVPSRNGLSHAAAAMTDRVRDDIMANLTVACTIVLVLDEWTMRGGRRIWE